MKKLVALLVVALCASSAQAFPIQLFNDSTGDVFTGAGGGILDIASVEVANDATDITFKFTHTGDNSTDWGKYMVIIDSVAGGDTAGNGWGRPISQPSGADYWLGSWIDGGGGMELYQWAGSWPFPPNEATWNASTDVFVTWGTNDVTLHAKMVDLGLTLGDTFCFDAFTSGGGGGDGAIDSLGNPGVQVGDWGQFSEAHNVCYTTPEPASLVLVGLGALALIRRRR